MPSEDRAGPESQNESTETTFYQSAEMEGGDPISDLVPKDCRPLTWSRGVDSGLKLLTLFFDILALSFLIFRRSRLDART